MTEDIKVTRLSKAAREFNVGISTIVEFLHKKGFELDPNPNTKLPPDAYNLLVKEYSTDISVKKESEKLILKDLHRKKESVSIEDFSEKPATDDSDRDDNVLIKDSTSLKSSVDIKTEIKKPDIKLVGKIDLDKATRPKVEKPAPPKEEPVVKKPVAVQPPEPEKPKEKAPVAEKEKPVVEVPSPVDEAKSKSNIDLRIVGKIDLDTVTREKQAKKEEPKEKEKEQEKEKEKEKEKKKAPEAEKEEEAAPVLKEEKQVVKEEPVKEPEEIIEAPVSEAQPQPQVPVEQGEDVVSLYKTDFKKN
ncbi:MAG TPA: hypothetical protein VHO68_04260 [Bacteroidales bacterium]|nr:hypothetical protein [Bacteroidales bacterium]